MKDKYYLIRIQFCGFRYCGWQKQTNGKTLQGMVDKTFSCIFGHEKFKTLGAGRTDSKVSANEFAFELFVTEELDEKKILHELNLNLPADIKALKIEKVSQEFNIINDSNLKEYLYLFSYGEKKHPFSAPLMVNFSDSLNIELMKKGAELFQGTHDFRKYCYKAHEKKEFTRTIKKCEIIENNLYTANFFPEKSWIMRVEGKGFMRHQVRLVMGTLVSLGRGDLDLKDISESFNSKDYAPIGFIAPSSGLMLNKIIFS